MEQQLLAQPARAIWRLPIIRHARYFVYRCRITHHFVWGGHEYSAINKEFDRRYLNQIWRGLV